MTELAADALSSLSTPGKVDSRIGPLEFSDGAPAGKAVDALHDHLDFVHGLNASRAFPAASTDAMRQGFHDIGARDDQVLIVSKLMDSSSRFLTANAELPGTTFVEGSGLAFNIIPPTDARFFETGHAALQNVRASSR